AAPETFTLSQNYPNPFNPTTTINFTVPRKYIGGVKVSLKIYNIKGQIMRTLMDEDKAPGVYSVLWDGKNNQGEWLSSGLYFYTVHVGEFTATRKMMFLK
ncbi:MAG: FlgD immunoglobulin-like domain containing protein, partial [bacterium]